MEGLGAGHEGHGRRCDRRGMQRHHRLPRPEFRQEGRTKMRNRFVLIASGMGALIGCAGVAQAQWASEAGFAVVQQQCMKCHGKASMPQAPGVAALREFSGQKIYEFLTSGLNGTHKAMTLSDDDKKHVAESLSGRLLGSEAVGDAKAMPNRCASNPPMGDPA